MSLSQALNQFAQNLGRYLAHNVADTQKARKLLDFTPSISLQEGLTEFCEWVLGQETDNSRYEQSLTELERSGMFIRK